jgi:hypothetical protein
MNILFFNINNRDINNIINSVVILNSGVNIYHNNHLDGLKSECLFQISELTSNNILEYIIEKNISLIISPIILNIKKSIYEKISNICKILYISKIGQKSVIKHLSEMITNPLKVVLNTPPESSKPMELITHKNQKEEFRYFCNKYLDYIRKILLPVIKMDEQLEAVLIEYRCLPHLEFLIRNCIIKLGDKWSQTIICGNNNYDFICDIVKKIGRDIKIINSQHDNLTPSTYSLFLASTDFWNLLVGDKILIYQEDTCIFKSNIAEFLKWDYIGAPWPKGQNDTHNCVGNGGLSLRTKSKMIEVINTISIEKTNYNNSTRQYMKGSMLTIPPEDVYFSKNIQDLNIGDVADWDTARNFSCEAYVHEDSFGAHGVWVNNIDLRNKILYKRVIPQVSRPCDWPIEHRGGWSQVRNALNDYHLIDNNNPIEFYDYLEAHFIWKRKREITKKWIGMIHLTPYTPEHLNNINIKQIINNKFFKNSLNNCICLMTCSIYIKDFLTTELKKKNYDIPVYALKHPTELNNIKLFTADLYEINKNKSIIQIGRQLRKMSSIFFINTHLKKVWLTGTKQIEKIKSELRKECKISKINHNINSVDIKYLHSSEEYDDLLSKNIVFIDLYDAGANNTVLECIARNTPIIVNRIQGVIEYLGKDYPLYFDNLTEVPSLINRYKEGYDYLYKMDKSSLHIDSFMSQFTNILNKEIAMK